MAIFNVHDPALDVSRSFLIEASAGTGKTYSIENIVVRTLLEGKAPPSIRELLVVTFTKAAAKDLKTRIKKCLEAKKKSTTDETALRRVKQALVEFDQAHVSTIHAFCFKALAENTIGLKKGSESSSAEFIWEVIERYFRVGLNGYTPEQLNILLKQNSVTELTREIIKFLGRGLPFAKSLTNEEGFKLLDQALQEIDGDLLAAVDAYGACYKGFANRDGTAKNRKVFEYLANLQLPPLREAAEVLGLLSKENLKVRAKVPEEALELFQFLQDRITPLLYQLGSYPALLIRLADECKKKLFAAFEEKDLCDFNYLLHKMERLSLHDEEFKKGLRTQFKRVIIDEFQDTDPVQWKIFEQIFLNAGVPLILVGDPKQSIYAFRSADIYTYLEAANTLDSKYVLDTNYRSTPGLIRALNHLFKSAPMPLPYLKSELSYLPVKPAPDKQDTTSPSLEFWIAPQEESLFAYAVKEIFKLQMKRIPLSEMAFLVSDHRQSDRLFQFFSSCGLPTFQLRGVDFHKAAVLQDLLYLLRALLSPRNIGHVQAALGTCFFGWSFQKCQELKDHEVLAPIVASFYAFHYAWKAYGVGRALQEVFFTYGVEERLAGTPEGRLRYHEAIQILEWLAKKEAIDKLSCEACFDELEALQDFDSGPLESMKLRPLAQKNALPILTLHTSKGLEFEVVFALGVMTKPPLQGEIVSVRKELQAAKKGSKEYLECLEENDAEKARQLYVALTRAKSKLYVPVPEKLGESSPIELLLAKLGDWEKHCQECADIAIIKIPEERKMPSPMPFPQPLLYPPKKVTLSYPERLSVSYSSLAKVAAGESIGAPHDFNPLVFSPHTLPAGAVTGELLHEILEKVPLHLIKEDSLLPFVNKFTSGTLFAPWSEVLAKMVGDAFQAPYLSSLTEEDVFREIEFMYPLENDVVKGVIDLFFIYKGKYYLLDWKTNWLGIDQEAYHQEALTQAMLHHRYDLQADLYTCAIQKYLEKVDPRPFQEIFGGVIYHFLRGNRAYVRVRP